MDFEKMEAKDLVKWAWEQYGDQLALACSFGPEDIVLIHMAQQVAPALRIFSIDTGRLPEETLLLSAELQKSFNLQFEWLFPDRTQVEGMLRKKGAYSFLENVENRKECCDLRKVRPLKAYLRYLDAWMTGLRREQNVTRQKVLKVELDKENGGIKKISPLAAWSESQVWDYIKKEALPFNSLHQKGYPSIGCAPCSRPVKPGEDPRSGRWWWEKPETKECGLHWKGGKLQKVKGGNK